MKTDQTEQDKANSDTDLARIEVQGNTNAISRVLAVMILMIAPGIGGSYIDRYLETSVFTLVGFVIGICIAIFGMLYVAKIADETAKRNRERKRELDSRQ